jgi:hypothetical protein
MIRRMMLIAASCPSKSEAAVTMRIWCWGWYLTVGKVMVLGLILDSRPEIEISIALNTPANIGKTTLSFFVFLSEPQNLKETYSSRKGCPSSLKIR